MEVTLAPWGAFTQGEGGFVQCVGEGGFTQGEGGFVQCEGEGGFT